MYTYMIIHIQYTYKIQRHGFASGGRFQFQLNLEEAGSWFYPPQPGHGKPFQGEQPIDSVKRQVKVNKDQEAGSKHGVMMGNGHHMSSLYFFYIFSGVANVF